MRNLKWIVRITFGICMVCLLLVLLFQNAITARTLLYDIPLAVFGSAVLGFIMSLIQYYSERRKCTERFYLSALTILDKLGSLLPYNSSWSKEQFNQALNSLITVSYTSLDEIRDAYGDLDYLVSNKKLKKELGYGIYERCKTDIKYLLDQSNNAHSFIQGEQPEEITRARYNEFSDEWFKKEYGNVIDKDFVAYSYYTKHWNQLSGLIEEFRSKIYHEKPKEYTNRSVATGIEKRNTPM